MSRNQQLIDGTDEFVHALVGAFLRLHQLAHEGLEILEVRPLHAEARQRRAQLLGKRLDDFHVRHPVQLYRIPGRRSSAGGPCPS
jgi:hypothetical protein